MKKNKNQEYAILWLNEQNKKPGEIAEELDIGVDKVESVLRVNKEPQKASKSKSKDLMINKTSSKGNKSVSIMTGEASALNDELRKKNVTTKKDTQSFIFRPND